MFEYCDHVDIHALDPSVNLKSLAIIANEHGFRGVVVPSSKVQELSVHLATPNKRTKVKTIGIIDFPSGYACNSSRRTEIVNCQELGAKEVEIIAPYSHILSGDWGKFEEDITSIVTICNRINIDYKITLLNRHQAIRDKDQAKIYRILAAKQVECISIGIGETNSPGELADQVMRMRNILKKTMYVMKVYLNTSDPEQSV